MWIILSILIGSMFLGYLLRKKLNAKLLDRLLLYSIFLLLFFMGVSIGSDDKILSSLPVLGLDALYLALASILGSIIFAWGIYKKWFKNKR